RHADRDHLAGIDRGHPHHGHEDATSARDLDDETEDSRELTHGRSIDDDGIADPSDLSPERVEHGRGDESGDEDSFRWTAHGLRLRAASGLSGRANRIEPRSHEAGSLPARLLFLTWTLLLHFLVAPRPYRRDSADAATVEYRSHSCTHAQSVPAQLSQVSAPALSFRSSLRCSHPRRPRRSRRLSSTKDMCRSIAGSPRIRRRSPVRSSTTSTRTRSSTATRRAWPGSPCPTASTSSRPTARAATSCPCGTI